MRNKKAKKIRGDALAKTRGLVDVAYTRIQHLGKGNQVVLDKACSRAVYKKMKRDCVRGCR